MTRTVTAFFDSRAEAEAARTRLTQSNIDAERVQIIDQSHAGSSGMTGGGSGGSSDGQGFWSSLKSAFLPEEDSHAYEEGLRRGGYLLCAQVYENQADEAIRILDQDDAVDFDQRQSQWKNEGWSGYSGGTTGDTTGGTAGLAGMGLAPGGSTGSPSLGQSTTGQRDNVVQEEHIPIVEEELRIGKREVNRGGARVRSYVREVPVHEQVSLREEHVSVERRPVDQTLARGELDKGDLLRDRTIEMTETSEEAVIGKEAHVREELVVKKTAEQHVEEVNDTVRRTEVDVDENLQTGNQDRSAFGFKDSSGSTGTGLGGGTGSTGLGGGTGLGSDRDRDRDRETQGSGYTDRIDKSGL
jgi:uncharacterized protein (TIGR02271 family)